MIQKRNPQSGIAAVLLALTTSIIIITIFGTAYTSIWYRQKNYVRIKEATKMFDIMETAAKAVRSSWDNATTSLPAGSTPAAIYAKMVATYPLTADASCSNVCRGMYGGAAPTLCYADPDGGKPYCLYGTPGFTAAKLELKIRDPIISPKIEKWALRKMIAESYILSFLDFFHGENKGPGNTSMVAFLSEQKAYGAVFRTDNVAVLHPGCPGNLGCLTCGAGNGAVCGILYACPLVFKGCSAYSGGATPPTAAGALFVQEFFLSPPGNAN